MLKHRNLSINGFLLPVVISSNEPRQTPPQSHWTLNFDCQTSTASIAGIRNDMGHMMVSFAKAITAAHPLEAELQALLEGDTICCVPRRRCSFVIMEEIGFCLKGISLSSMLVLFPGK